MTVASRARTMFKHRATIERDANADTTDNYGNRVAPDFQTLSVLPCRFWSRNRRHVVDGDKDAAVEEMFCSFALDADITEHDRIANIKDRQGATLVSGPLTIETLQYKHTHSEAAIRRGES